MAELKSITLYREFELKPNHGIAITTHQGNKVQLVCLEDFETKATFLRHQHIMGSHDKDVKEVEMYRSCSGNELSEPIVCVRTSPGQTASGGKFIDYYYDFGGNQPSRVWILLK